jgi:hypothetical protein
MKPTPSAPKKRGRPEGGVPRALLPEPTDKDLAWFNDQFKAEFTLIRDEIQKEIDKPTLPGAPIRMNPESVARMCAQIRHFVPPTSACVVNGIPKMTFFDWMRKGRSYLAGTPEQGARPVHAAFRTMVEKSIEFCKGVALAKLDSAANNDVALLKWLLSTRFPDEFGPRAGMLKPQEPKSIADVPGMQTFIDTIAQGIATLPPEQSGVMLGVLKAAIEKATAVAPASADPDTTPTD